MVEGEGVERRGDGKVKEDEGGWGGVDVGGFRGIHTCSTSAVLSVLHLQRTQFSPADICQSLPWRRCRP